MLNTVLKNIEEKRKKKQFFKEYIYQQPSTSWMSHEVNFLAEFNSLKYEASFSLTSGLTIAKESSLSVYLPISGGRIAGFIPFPNALVLW